MPDALLQGLALLASLCGMAWIALAMDVHWEQACGPERVASRPATRLRVLAALALAASLALFLAANHASIAVLAWVMSVVAATLAVAFVLATRPRRLAWLVLSRPRAAASTRAPDRSGTPTGGAAPPSR